MMRHVTILLAVLFVMPGTLADSYEDPQGDTRTVTAFNMDLPVACEDPAVDLVVLDVSTQGSDFVLEVHTAGPLGPPVTCRNATIPSAPGIPSRRIIVQAIPWSEASRGLLRIDSETMCATLEWEGYQSACFGTVSWTGSTFSWRGPKQGEVSTGTEVRAYELGGAPDVYLRASAEFGHPSFRIIDEAHFPRVAFE